MHPEVQELQPKLKEVLYDCAVEIRATKAALYLFDGGSRFELITEYGFRGAVRQSADRNDPVVDRCGRGRSPFFINGISADPRFSEVLYEASTDRLLAAPIYSRGALVGFVDMRDKAGKQTFDNADLPKSQRIAERFAEVFAGTNVFGQRFITVSGSGDAGAVVAGTVPVIDTQSVHAFAAAPRPAAPPPQPPPPSVAETQPVPATATPNPYAPIAEEAPEPVESAPVPVAPEAVAPAREQPALPVFVPEVRGDLPFLPTFIPEAPGDAARPPTLIEESRAVASRIIIPTSPESLTETELAPVHDILRSILLIPGAVVVVFTAFGHLGGVQEIAARSTLTDDAVALLQSRLNTWLTRQGKSAGQSRTSIRTPFGTTGPSIASSQIRKVFTAPVTAGSLRGLYLTVAFTAVPDRTAHELMATMLGQIQTSIESPADRAALQILRAAVAEKLLEPDFTKYPELRLHSDCVATRAESLARHLAMSQPEIDQVKLVARLHDVGMRLLDYEGLYRKRNLTPEEMNLLREHTAVGAAIVEPLLGSEIARAVLCHHEQWNGRGYPYGLQGEAIPRVARVVQVCDAFETMVAPDNRYQPAMSREDALSTIGRNAGSQFEPEVAHRFLEMLR